MKHMVQDSRIPYTKEIIVSQQVLYKTEYINLLYLILFKGKSPFEPVC